MEVAIRIFLMLGGLGFSVIFHEMAHAWVALKLGDPTGRDDNRLSWNPIHHIDPFMTIILPVLLYFGSHGSFVFGGAKPVQINPMNFRDPGKGMMLSSAAGPISNLLVAAGALLLLLLLTWLVPGLVVSEDEAGIPRATWNGFFFSFLTLLNLFLAVFNLVPIPPLDGSRVLRYFLPERGRRLLDGIEPFGLFILLGLLFAGILRYILAPLETLWVATMMTLFGEPMTELFIQSIQGA